MPDLTIQPLQTGSIKQLAVADNGDGTRSLRFTDTPGDEVSTIRLRQSGGMKQETGSHLLGDDCILCLPLRTNAADVGPNGFSVTNHGAVTFDAGDGASFNGTTQYLSVADNDLLDLGAEWTIAFSMKWQDVATTLSGLGYGLITKVDADLFDSGYDTQITGGGAGSSTFNAESLNAGNTGVSLSSPSELAADVQAQVVLVSALDGQRLYVNTVLVVDSGGVPDAPDSNAVSLLIGAYQASEVVNAATLFKGTMRDVFIAGRSWISGDVLAHYNGGAGQSDGGLTVAVEDPDILIDVPQGIVDLTVTRNTGETAWTLLVHTG